MHPMHVVRIFNACYKNILHRTEYGLTVTTLSINPCYKVIRVSIITRNTCMQQPLAL